MKNRSRLGVSLIEVIIVLAISAGALVIAINSFNSRRRVAYDDDVRQFISTINTVRNEAQKGLGPTDASTATFDSNDTIFGQAMEFRNDCNADGTFGDSCVRVYKLYNDGSNSSTPIKSYETYDIAMDEGLEFLYGWYPGTNNNCDTLFSSCRKTLQPNGDLSAWIRQEANSMIVVEGRTGNMYLFWTTNGIAGPIQNPSSYTQVRQGLLQQGMYVRENNTGVHTSGDIASARARYKVTINLSTPGDIRYEIQ